ncbi:4-hydroxybenzoate polyprenyl transferase [Diaporthe helianthi]|uniref:4-hydroxybenzoate polyprenyl transferase n=1 Tax=Diaporthe helianthi TaxID=158607 RepID=A0A2P5HJ62_DIAHE|nr:4-hydroxybenzoate polyprenyl transferase [Diaporthe helianthi]
MEFDRHVERCRSPQPPIGERGLLAAGRLVILPLACWLVVIPSVFLLWLYLFGKRFTDFLQAILGVQLAIGFLMGIVAQNDPILAEILLGNNKNASALAVSVGEFYLAQACWTVIYDTVYAQQDVEDQ